MIHDLDESLRKLIKRDALNGTDVEVVFDAPTKDWATRRNTPTLDVYLYDIREDLKWKAFGSVDLRGPDGFVTAREGPPRYFKFSYLITAWTQRPEDEHRLLSAVLFAFLRSDVLPKELLTGTLAAQGGPVRISIALPPPEDRPLSDIWSALGGELKPSLDLVALVAVDARRAKEVGPPVLEEPRIAIGGGGARAEEVGQRFRATPGGGGPGASRPARPGASRRVGPNGGTGKDHGIRLDDTTDLDDLLEAVPPVEEAVTGGKAGGPGRIFRVRTKTE